MLYKNKGMNSDVWLSSHVPFRNRAAIWVFPCEAVAPSALVVFACPCEGTGWLFERNSRSGYICWHTSQREVSLFSPDCYFWTFSEWAKSSLMIFTGWRVKPARSDSWALHCVCVMRSSGVCLVSQAGSVGSVSGGLLSASQPLITPSPHLLCA